jgi:ABC-type transport system substrate-binding protein
VGTGPFILKDYQPNVSLTLVKNPNYWQKDLPYLDGIEIKQVTDPMTQMLSLKAGQANAIYGVQSAATQLKAEGYPLQMAPGSIFMMNFDTKNSEIFSKRQVREAIEYAIDKEAICNGPGEGLYKPVYQIVSSGHPDYNRACPPRKYNPPKFDTPFQENDVGLNRYKRSSIKFRTTRLPFSSSSEAEHPKI